MANQILPEGAVSAAPPDEQLVTKDFLRAELADLKAALEARFAPIESDLRWTRWIITGGVGLYVLRSMVEWIR